MTNNDVTNSNKPAHNKESEQLDIEKIWQGLIGEFLTAKFEADLNKYVKETFKTIQKGISKSTNIPEDFEDFLDSRKNKKPDELSETEFLKLRMDDLFGYLDSYQDSYLSGVDKVVLRTDYSAFLEKIKTKYHANTWIEEASNNASSVTFATHVAKLTHSKIDSSSLTDSVSEARQDVLTTSSLANPIIDGAIAGNQFAPIYQFLSLKIDDITLAQAMASPNNTILKAFAKDDSQLANWNKRFAEVTQSTQLSTHTLAKQVYFPIDPSIKQQPQYHLLCHLTSSSLAQQIFNKMFNDDDKLIKNQYYDKKYHEGVFYDYPQKAAIAVTASNHSNASALNGRRGGKLYLFNAQPPTWQSQIKAPSNETSLFNHYLFKNICRDNLVGFATFFLGAQAVYKKPNIMAGIEKWLHAISEDVLTYASMIHQLPIGWSIDSKLETNNIEHCYFLDPYRSDDNFVAYSQSNEWQAIVSRDFGTWLNKQLHAKDDNFTPQAEHRKLWQKIFAQHLRDYMDIIHTDIDSYFEAAL